MSLRIRSKGVGQISMLEKESRETDTWESRIAKLLPAEALSLYGSGSALIPDNTSDTIVWYTLITMATVCLLLAILIRYQATKDKRGQPQWTAVTIAGVSFVLWVIALKFPVGLGSWGSLHFVPAIAALIWSAFVPFFYKGDPD